MTTRALILPTLLCLVFSMLAPVTAQEDDSAKIDSLIQKYFDSFKDKEARQKIVSELYQLGEAAMVKVESLGDEKKAKALRDAMYMEILVSEFRAIEKKHPDMNLIFVGQFTHLKKHGKRAVKGAMLLLKDFSLHEDRHHARGGEVLADLGDKSVLKELKDISEDFLMEDNIQLAAVYAMAALGDTSGIDKKIKEYQERIKDEPRNANFIQEQIANIYYHGRQFKKAANIYMRFITGYKNLLKERGADMEEKQVAAIKAKLANLCYNGACNVCLAKNMKGTYYLLSECLKLDKERGTYIKSIPRDGDLMGLREDKGFKEWYENAKKGVFPEFKMPEKKPEQKAEEPKEETPPAEPEKGPIKQ